MSVTDGKPATAPNLRRHPAQLLAFGFGSGLSPVAPGTAGTLVAVPIYLVVAEWGLLYYSLFILVTLLAGIWLCDVASRQLGVHDHPGIVWDEFVGFWIAMAALPVTWTSLILGFALFRFFDIVKPWPISWLDKKVSGGFGIMIDDIAAGIASALVLILIKALYIM